MRPSSAATISGVTPQPTTVLEIVTTVGDGPKKLLDDAQLALGHAEFCVALALDTLEFEDKAVIRAGAALSAGLIDTSRACAKISDYLDGFAFES